MTHIPSSRRVRKQLHILPPRYLPSGRGVYRWDEFRELLVQRIAGGPPGYYESWLEAFEDLLLARGLIGHAELRARAQEFKDLRRDPLL